MTQEKMTDIKEAKRNILEEEWDNFIERTKDPEGDGASDYYGEIRKSFKKLIPEGMKLGREEYIKELKVAEKQDLKEIEEAVKKRDNMIRTELIGEIEKLRLNDEFHQWYKDILGEDDILIKIVDKIKEKLLEKIRKDAGE